MQFIDQLIIDQIIIKHIFNNIKIAKIYFRINYKKQFLKMMIMFVIKYKIK